MTSAICEQKNWERDRMRSDDVRNCVESLGIEHLAKEVLRKARRKTMPFEGCRPQGDQEGKIVAEVI